MSDRHPIPGLLTEQPINLYPSLAARVGVNKAIILQQIHFLLTITEKSKNAHNYVDGHWWVYNTYQKWHDEHFTWLTPGTIKRLFLDLEKAGLLVSITSPYDVSDQTKWYRIDYDYWGQWYSADDPSQKETGPVTKRDGDPSQKETGPVTKRDGTRYKKRHCI